MSTEIVPLAVILLILACIYYPIVLGALIFAGFLWGFLACFFPRLRI